MGQRFASALAMGLALIVCGLLWSRTSVAPLSEFDQTFYIGIAHDLRSTGRFTDGVFAPGDAQQLRPPGMRFAPLYPGLIVATAAWDEDFARAMECVVRSNGGDAMCPAKADLIRLLQLGMLAAFLWLVWWIAGNVLDSQRAGWIALLLASMAVPLLLRYVNYVMTEVTALLLLTSAIAAAVRARREPSVAWLFVAGLCLGLTALTRPAYLYLGYACVLVGLALVCWRESRLRSLLLLLGFVAGLGATVLPWIARNAVVLGRPALTYGYDSHTLAQRVAYNRMNWEEYGLFYVCSLPGGKGIANALVRPDACKRFSWTRTETNAFYVIGNTTFMEETLAAGGGWPHHLTYLVRNHILAAPLKHVLVTVPFALAGAWVNHYWGLVLCVVCVVVTVRALRAGNHGMLLVTLPGWFMLLFHASVAINQTRYNLILILPYSIAGAWLIERAFLRPGVPNSPS
jgi:4-amino-4-deoxy-L-arabinose transferase-like glycosyltransferase